MKKVFVLLIAFVMAMSSAALAADIKIGGEFEAAGICQRNFDFDKNVDDHTRTWYGNLVLSMEAQVAENISVFASYTLVDGTWGDEKYDTPSGFSNASGVASDDVAYAVVGIDSYTVTVGRQLDVWGNMMLAGGDGMDRFKVSTMLGGFEHSIFTDKIVERDQPDLKDDVNRYGFQVERVSEDEEHGMGLYLWHAMSNGIANIAGTEVSEDVNGYGMDIYYRDVVGPVELSAELSYQAGDAETENTSTTSANGWTYGKDRFDKSRMGLFVTGEYEMESLGISGTLAYAKNNFVAGDYFNPTLMTGVDQDNAIYNFGELLADSTSEGDSAMLIALALEYGISENWTLGAGLAQHTFADDMGLKGTEVDLMAEYQINEGATWGLYVAHLSPEGFKDAGLKAEDDAAMSVVQSLFIEF